MELDSIRQRRESENNDNETSESKNLLESHNLKENESTSPISVYDKPIENELEIKHENTTLLQDKIMEENKLKSIAINKNQHKIRKRITVVDSDSEDDMKIENSNEIQDVDVRDLNDSNEAKKQLSSRKSRMLESDSEDEIDNLTGTYKDCETNTNKNRNISRNKINFDESDSDLEDKDDKPVEQDAIYTINSNGKLVAESSTVKSSNWAALCDSESSGPENSDKEQEDNSDSEKVCHSDEIIKPIKYKKKNIRKDESHEMSAKQATKQREEIRSESQRMLRESNISLPYHRPKSFTLKDFLARRPKFASANPLTSKLPSSIAIKMSDQQLEVISKKLEERHKEVREFYKSDDEEEDSENNEVLLDSEKETNSDKSLQTLDNRDETKYIEKNIDNIENINEALSNGDNLDVNKNLENLDKKTIETDANEVRQCAKNEAPDSTDYERLTEENKNINKIIENKEHSEGKKITIISEYVIKDGIENNYSPIENTLTEEIDTGLKINIPSNSDSLSIDSGKEHLVIDEIYIENKSIDKNVDNPSQSPINYEFNLDDIEEYSENILNNDKDIQRTVETSDNLQVNENVPKNRPKQFVFDELDMEIENFGNDEQPPLKISDGIGNDSNNETHKFKLDILKSRLSNIKPRLSGDLNHFIDLDDLVKPNEVTKLMERFAQHTAKIIPHKDRVKLNIVSVEHGGEIHKETLAVRVDDEEDLSIEEKPGARLQKLRNELQSQIAQRKSEIWQQKALVKESNQFVKDTYDGEKSECGADDAILDDDEEEEEEMSESSEEDEEEIEDVIKEENLKKSVFVDDEADVDDEIEEYHEHFKSDGEENDDDEDNVDDDNDNNVDGDADDEENEVVDHKNNVNETSPVSKPLRRIIQCFSDDSDEDEDFGVPGETIKKIAEKLNRSNEDTNNTQEDYIRPYQLQNHTNKTPIKSISESSNCDLKFLTPVSYITGLQNLTNSVSKANVPSPLKETDWHAELERKLHADSIITNSQAEAMRELFSETVSESQDVLDNRLENINTTTKSNGISLPQTVPPNTQDILNICSGRFDEPSSSMPPSTQDILNICSGKFTGISQVSESIPNVLVTNKATRVEEVKYLSEDQDMIISQLINEEEMEAFKKKFDSPVLTHVQNVVDDVEVERGGGIIDSDEEVLEVKKKNRNQKKLTFSDDESSNEDDEEKEEEINLHDNIEEENEEMLPDEINYDSEENEVDYSEEKEKGSMKMADFFEAEAELSESEWGSADEDEKDLDTLEFEQGDQEKFDEKQLKTDLEKIHMRRLLDDDTREVKLLQEMLLDDGELHGTGRERQFKWKTLDSDDFPIDDEKKDSDDENCIEDENEEQWRKKRHEREMFLKEKNSQETKDDDLLSGSEILKLGHKVIQKSMSNSSQGVKVSLENPDLRSSPAVKRSFSLLHKRGSFLTRGDQVLERVAEFNKTSSLATMATGKTTKNSKNFLFQRVGQETITTTSFLDLKRKAEDGTPKVIKKLRLTDNLSPALNRKKTTNKHVKTKLFGIS